VDSHEVECAVIGGGVVGLAIARALALAGREVWLLDKNAHIGEETSSRNSEVIHAGIYYEAGSLKGTLCVEGKHLLYDFCARRGVPHARVTKLIVASDAAELPALETVVEKAAGNGVRDLQWLTGAEAMALEPALSVAGALLSPSTGIVDSHAFMLALIGEAEAHGASIVTGARVRGGHLLDDGRMALDVDTDPPVRLVARHVVNSAGLWAQGLARRLEGLDQASIPGQRFARGHYFALSGRSPFSRLIYPVPGGGGLGVHVTLDLGGRAKFGPDVEWLDAETPDQLDYGVDPARGLVFYAAVRRYWPGLPDGALLPDYSGIRPKLGKADGQNVDFRIDGAERHGAPGHVMLYGIESPGLTASLAIAERVRDMVTGQETAR
jgi:L-2-hydroxyglutarate oxidase LhgO